MNRLLNNLPKIIPFVFLACLTMPKDASAHEFWIDPIKYQIAPDENIVADFRNGEEFKGSQLGFFDRRSARLDVIHASKVQNISPRNGDRPAVDVGPSGDGLHILVHETTPSTLTYKTWDKFQKFANHKNFQRIKERHEDRGLPSEDFKESYTRHVKALVGVGTGKGSDHVTGLETEFVAVTNPYDQSFTQNMRVFLYENKLPRKNAQVEIFEKSDSGKVTITLTRTDETGLARFATKPGHSYLIDAVVLRPSNLHGIAWETYWAALTFAVPAQ